MGFPLILAYEGSEFARLNYNGSWTINKPLCHKVNPRLSF